MNIFTFTGNLGNDCEVKYAASGTAICNFSVAVKSGYGDKQKTNWVRCSLIGKRAEGQLPGYLLKGTQVAVSGELELQEWEGQNGKGAALSVVVSNIDLIGGNQQGNQAQQQSRPQQQTQQRPQQGYQQQAPRQQYGNQQEYQNQQQQRFAPQQGSAMNPMEPPMDFSDDIPFAPIGLQYPKLLSCM